MIKKAIWLPLGLIAILAVAIVGLSNQAVAGQAAPQATIGVSSATVAPNGSVVIDFSVTPAAGVDVGAYDVTITDDALVSATACTHSAGACNAAFAADTVSFNAASLSAITGNVGTITYLAGASTGVTTLTVAITACADTAAALLTCAPQNGTITIAQATATPSPSPTPVATATPVGGTATPTSAAGTATPGALPSTGAEDGNFGSGGSSALPLLLAAIGMAAMTAGGWAVFRLRRNTNA